MQKKKEEKNRKKKKEEKGRIAILHPELIIGGAERLLLDMALGLESNGYKPHFFAGFLNRGNCFKEIQDNIVDVTIYGQFIPRKMFGKFQALFTVIRMLYVSLRFVFATLFSSAKYDLIICDQVSIALPLLKLLGKPIFYYCHFPDRFLSKPSSSVFKRIYRSIVDWLERVTLKKADAIAVNSRFTKDRFSEAFSSISKEPVVLYPPINPTDAQEWTESKRVAALNSLSSSSSSSSSSSIPQALLPILSSFSQPSSSSPPFIILSINRFESQKKLHLLLESYDFCTRHAGLFRKEAVLVIAGGYDCANDENVACLKGLEEQALTLGIAERVFFVKSFSNTDKQILLSSADCLVYTPANEPFGIVPVEAMLYGLPVIAVESGGPTESVVNNSTGYLCEQSASEFSQRILKIYLKSKEERTEMGQRGREHTQTLFSLQTFNNGVLEIVSKLLGEG